MADDYKVGIGRPPLAHRFQVGNPGRPKGSRNKIVESFLSALHKDFMEHGATAIAGARAESPLGYIKVVAGLIPQKIEVEKAAAAMTDDELIAIIRGSEAKEAARAAKQPNVESVGTA